MPLGILILAIFSIVGGLFSVLWGIGVSGVGGVSWMTGLITFSDTVRAWGGGAFWGGMLSILTGVVQVIVGFGLFSLQTWAYWLAWISATISLINPVVGLLSGNFWAIWGLIIPGVIFFYLTFDDDVKQAFRPA